MAQLEVLKGENAAHDGTYFHFHSNSPEGDVLEAEAEFLPHAGQALIKFKTAQNIAAGLETVVDAIKAEARKEYWKANPHASLRIDIDAGSLAPRLRQIVRRFGFSHQQHAGELGTEGQWTRFRLEIPPQSKLPLAG